jgi:hypothetical protein
VNSKPGSIEILLERPLSETTRKERRALLVVSTIGIAVARVGLVPTKVPALGIEFSSTETSALVFLLSLVVIYFFLLFFVYAGADIALWRASYHSLQVNAAIKHVSELSEVELAAIRKGVGDQTAAKNKVGDALKSRAWFLGHIVTPLSIFRLSLDFVFPIFLAIYAFFSLLTAPIGSPPGIQPPS